MAKTLEEIRSAALELPDEERSWLAHDLWESFLTTEERAIQQDWINAAEERAEDLRGGKVVGIPLEDVMRDLRAKYGFGRRSSS
jgi:putative addiction module component (TIGR02574 family)